MTEDVLAERVRCRNDQDQYVLVHPPLELARGHALRGEHVHNAAPPREAITIDTAQKALRERLEQVIWLEIWPEHGLTEPIKSLGAIAGNNEIVSIHLVGPGVEEGAESGTLLGNRCVLAAPVHPVDQYHRGKVCCPRLSLQ